MTRRSARPSVIRPDWEVPDSVVALVTTRIGGVSCAPFDTFNLALHVGDDDAHVRTNREILREVLEAPLHLQWLRQVHGTGVVRAVPDLGEEQGDAVFVDKPGLAGVVMTADCLPIFLAARDGRSAAVVHAGWRGLANGVLENALDLFQASAGDILCWLGPAIGPCHFEVGAEVRQAFLDTCPGENVRSDMAARAFRPAALEGKYLADLYTLARLRLQWYGVVDVRGGGLCTHCDRQRFYSYRRDRDTGRMASVIGLKEIT